MKMQTVTVHKVTDSDFEQEVKDFFGVEDYSFQAAEEAGNDTVHEFDVSLLADESDWNRNQVEMWLESPRHYLPPSARLLLNRLARAERIPAGKYLISISY